MEEHKDQHKDQKNHDSAENKEHHEHHEKKEHKKEKTQEEIIKEKDEKIHEWHDKYLRALAELDNYRKRVQKDKEDFVKFTRGDMAGEILPVLDNLERAVSTAGTAKDVETFKKGIEIIIKQFNDTLTKIGVKEIDTKIKFNPEFHHVMFKEHRDDKEEGEILEVYQKGYLLEDKIIRPAMVKVAVKEDAKPEAQKQDGEAEKNGEKQNNA